MYLAKANYKEEDVIHVLTELLKTIIKDNTVIICIGTDRCIGDSLGPLVGTMLKNSDYKYPVYGTLDKPIHALNIYESLSDIQKKHPDAIFIAIDACLGEKSNIGNIQIREGPIHPGKGVGKILPKIGNYSIVAIVDEINEDSKFTFSNIRLNFIIEMSEIIATSIILAT
ncbi:spore protease YyaC [Tepidibacter thalassicus]|uniref:Putative sporulation protein YyaC n=1 Tax=Tepidibacter thalassicus DSM 15285 TaxID=1123350 RepID=A0A1M5R1N5_9FIRM|nr:spore protease YyaC [Tepidibacter thalassicus]SHH19879.1 putative sporulation protein YyaC [Tepidibacter thalassicus DSM 15285]